MGINPYCKIKFI